MAEVHLSLLNPFGNGNGGNIGTDNGAAAVPPPGGARWDKSHRRGGRPFRLAAIVVAVAGIVFIAVIFWSGYILGACERGERHHHGHGEGESGQESGGTERHNGMTPYGVVIEQPMPSARFAV